MPPNPPPARPIGAMATLAVVAVIVALAAAGLWWVRQDDTTADGSAGTSSTDADGDRGSKGEDDGGSDDGGSDDSGTDDPSLGDPELGEKAEDIAAQDFPDDPRVVVISVDGLGSSWVSQATTPTLAMLFTQGAGTLNARTEYEKTVTLPNHTGMVTGDRVDAAHGGHGVTWNHTSDRSVLPGTDSVFTTIADAGGGSAVFAGKEKFEMWGRAWPSAIDELVIMGDQPALVAAAVDDLQHDEHDLLFLHLGGPDGAGHESGWGSPAYLDALAQADADIATVVATVSGDPELSEEVVVVVTADHGGVPGTTGHSERMRPENYTIPFLVWGPGIAPGDLYALNPDYRDPGRGLPDYDGPQPVRNGDVANLVTDLLGLEPVPGSLFDTGHDLDVD